MRIIDNDTSAPCDGCGRHTSEDLMQFGPRPLSGVPDTNPFVWVCRACVEKALEIFRKRAP